MESYISTGAILVPILDSRGSTEANKQLAEALAKRSKLTKY